MLSHPALRAVRATFLTFALALAAAAQAAPVPIETFFQNTAFGGAKLSPNGRHVALGVTPKGGHTQLVVLDTQTMKAKAVASPSDADVALIEWVNDDRLVFNVTSRETPVGTNFLGPGLYAVQRDGTDFRQLVDREQPWVREKAVSRTMLDFFTSLHATTRKKDSDDVFVVRDQYDEAGEHQNRQMLRLNTRTGISTQVRGPGRAYSWMVDQNDVPRIAASSDKGTGTLKIYDSQKDTWETLLDFDLYVDGKIYPMGFGPDGTLFVAARGRKDKDALYRFDLKARKLEAEPLVAVPDFDLWGDLVQDANRLLGVHFTADAETTVWFDESMKQVQARVDKLLPATVNMLLPAVRSEVPLMLVRTYSDTDPGRYLLFDTASGKLTELGPIRRDIDPRQMATMDFVRYAARDGLSIPAWLTLPKGTPKGKKLPMVVLVHGGPWVRKEWGWYSDVQFLASRGYAVLEPEFRGSSGYGFAHFAKSFKQWGLAMQDDVADGAKWAIDKGIADPDRICIAGASYGGYATLMGLVRNPELFRCGVAWAGVTDIDLMYKVLWSDLPDQYKMYGMPTLLGDQQKDAAQFRETSPLQQAARIKQPVLLAHGGADRRVPIIHGVKMRDALAKSNPNVEWVEYEKEGHGWRLVPTRLDFWTRVEKFLQKNIGDK